MTAAWYDMAACKDKPTAMFFPRPDDIQTTREALAVCKKCPVKRECLADALQWPESMDFGIRGGYTEQQREELGRDLTRYRELVHPGHGSPAGYNFERKHWDHTCQACRNAEATRARIERSIGKRK